MACFASATRTLRAFCGRQAFRCSTCAAPRRRPRMPTSKLLWAVVACAVGLGCRREERRFSEPPSASQLSPNPLTAARSDRESLARYAKDAWAMSEGQRLYSQMNCEGCHGHGGG